MLSIELVKVLHADRERHIRDLARRHAVVGRRPNGRVNRRDALR